MRVPIAKKLLKQEMKENTKRKKTCKRDKPAKVEKTAATNTIISDGTQVKMLESNREFRNVTVNV